MIPDGYEILEYLNGTVPDRQLEFVLEHLRGLRVKHFNRVDVRIALECSEDLVRLLLIAKKKINV
jgi:hypothetical protein